MKLTERIRQLDTDWKAAVFALAIGVPVIGVKVATVMSDESLDHYPNSAPLCVDPELDPYDPIELRQIQEQIRNCITK